MPRSLAIVLFTLAAQLSLLAGGAAGGEDIVTVDICHRTEAHPRHDHQLIFPLLDGTLLCVWSEYYVKPSGASGAQRDDMPCRISALRSSDRGRTWGEPSVLQENTGKLNVKHPSLLRLQGGEVLFFFTQWNSMTERIIFVRRSSDDCRTWSEPVRVSTLDGINNINNDHVFRLSAGRIVVPAFQSPSVWDKADHFRAFCYYSDDQGRTWQMSSNRIDLPSRGAEEPSMVERKDGSILAVLRTSLGAIYQSVSVDQGQTWGKPAATVLKAPASPPLLKRIPSTGDLLLIWNNNYQPRANHQGERTPLTSAISRDDGATWEHIKDVERVPGGSAAYAAVLFQSDEALVTYYYQPKGFGGASGVRLKIVPIAWFYE